MDYLSLSPVIGTVTGIRLQSDDCCRQFLFLNTDNGSVNFILSPQTQVLGSTRLRPGMRVAAYYDRNLPPQTTPRKIVVLC